MTESKGGRVEHVSGSRVPAGIVAGAISGRLELQVVLHKVFLAEDAGKELPVVNLLEKGSDNLPCFLEQGRCVPVRSDFPEFLHDPVVFADKHQVITAQRRNHIDAMVSCNSFVYKKINSSFHYFCL